MAKEELFRNSFISYFVRQFGAFPVYRGRSNRDALREAERVLKRGDALGLFPEGKRSRVDSLQPALYGSALIAYHNRSAIVPVAITGSEVMRGFSWIWSRPKVRIIIGWPFYLPQEEQVLTKTNLAEYTDIIMRHIAEMLPEKYRGEYALSERAAK